MDAKALAAKAAERKVAYVPGAPFYPNGGHGNHLRLNFSTMREDRIVEGIRILGQLLREELAKGRVKPAPLPTGALPARSKISESTAARW